MMPVAVTLSILAVLVAIATLLGHRASTEELILQSKAAGKSGQKPFIRFHSAHIDPPGARPAAL